MGRWCPQCGSEYVEGWGTCSQCGVELVDEPPRRAKAADFGPEDAIFIEPRAARTYEDPFVPIWEGTTREALGLSNLLEQSSIPCDLGEALEPGYSRLEVPRSYVTEAYGLLDAAGADPLPLGEPHDPFEPEEEIGWSPRVRIALWVIAILLIVSLIVTSRF